MPVTLSNPGIITTVERNRISPTVPEQQLSELDTNNEQAIKALSVALYFGMSGTLCIVFALINEIDRHASLKAAAESPTTNARALTNAKWRGIASASFAFTSAIATAISIYYYCASNASKNKTNIKCQVIASASFAFTSFITTAISIYYYAVSNALKNKAIQSSAPLTERTHLLPSADIV